MEDWAKKVVQKPFKYMINALELKKFASQKWAPTRK